MTVFDWRRTVWPKLPWQKIRSLLGLYIYIYPLSSKCIGPVTKHVVYGTRLFFVVMGDILMIFICIEGEWFLFLRV